MGSRGLRISLTPEHHSGKGRPRVAILGIEIRRVQGRDGFRARGQGSI